MFKVKSQFFYKTLINVRKRELPLDTPYPVIVLLYVIPPSLEANLKPCTITP